MEHIVTDEAPAYGTSPLSQATATADTVYVAGQIGVDPDTGELVSDDVTDQAEQTFENLMAVLEAAGSSPEQVLKATVFLTDLEYYDAVNEVYSEYLSAPFPARSAIAVADLVIDAKVEVELVAER